MYVFLSHRRATGGQDWKVQYAPSNDDRGEGICEDRQARLVHPTVRRLHREHEHCKRRKSRCALFDPGFMEDDAPLRVHPDPIAASHRNACAERLDGCAWDSPGCVDLSNSWSWVRQLE